MPALKNSRSKLETIRVRSVWFVAFLYGIVHSEATLALITRNSEAWTVIATLVQVTREDLHLLPMANDNNETNLVGSH